MKKFVTVLLALVLSLSVCTVFAADTPQVQPLASPNPIAEQRLFTDVEAGDWYCAAIEEQAMKYGFIKGVSGTEFDPMGDLTRGQLVTILWRMDNKPLLTPEEDFAKFYFPNLSTDPIPEWALDAAVWAGFYGIVKGYPDGTFRANEPVTREQLLVICCRYAAYRGYDTVRQSAPDYSDDAAHAAYRSNNTMNRHATDFSDYEAISPYAVSTVNWALNMDIINGEAETLEPQKIVSRADMASMVMRLQRYFNNYDDMLAQAGE